MERNSNKLMLKLSRLLPSSFTSCHFRALPDVAESSIPLSPQTPNPNPKPKTLRPRSAYFTSSDDVDTDAFFSLSSNSGDSFHLPPAPMKIVDKSAEKKPLDPSDDYISTEMYYAGGGGRRRRRRRSPREAVGSYAVEKRTSDPRGEFRASMVEMIMEKRIFAAEDLQRLLRCFLSLNAAAYHGIIFEVFNEICDTLFSN